MGMITSLLCSLMLMAAAETTVCSQTTMSTEAADTTIVTDTISRA